MSLIASLHHITAVCQQLSTFCLKAKKFFDCDGNLHACKCDTGNDLANNKQNEFMLNLSAVKKGNGEMDTWATLHHFDDGNTLSDVS